MIENFNKLGVNISSLLIEQNVSTGVAPILVTDEGSDMREYIYICESVYECERNWVYLGLFRFIIYILIF